jgi:hypothetical protein
VNPIYHISVRFIREGVSMSYIFKIII